MTELMTDLGETASWVVRQTNSPEEKLLYALWQIKWPDLDDRPLDPLALRSALDTRLQWLGWLGNAGSDWSRYATILKLRFGLNGGEPKTLQEVGRVLNVTGERIREMEFKALRKLRRQEATSRVPLLPYVQGTALDSRVRAARSDLLFKLSNLYPEAIARRVVMNLKRSELRQAFESTEDALRFSCGRHISHCLGCGKPLPPGWTVCDRHCRTKWNQLTLTCARCGGLFTRPESQFWQRPRKGEKKAPNRFYCCRACFAQRDGDGPPCGACGRPRQRHHVNHLTQQPAQEAQPRGVS